MSGVSDADKGSGGSYRPSVIDDPLVITVESALGGALSDLSTTYVGTYYMRTLYGSVGIVGEAHDNYRSLSRVHYGLNVHVWNKMVRKSVNGIGSVLKTIYSFGKYVAMLICCGFAPFHLNPFVIRWQCFPSSLEYATLSSRSITVHLLNRTWENRCRSPQPYLSSLILPSPISYV